MSADRDDIIKFCTEYLRVEKFSDHCHNGLQVAGAKEVNKIIAGVSLSQALIKVAIAKKAQMIIVHHGFFKDAFGQPPVVEGYAAKRLKLLLNHDINFAGFHLPLDAHPIIGNNISLAKLFGLKNIKPIDTPDYGEIGFIGNFDRAKLFSDFVAEVNQKLKTKAYVIAVGPEKIKRLGIVSGGASPDFAIAAKMRADVYLCGDIKEGMVEAIKETNINFINAGHYNTEKLGIQNLGNLIAKKFKIKVEFVDIPCEV